MRDIHCPKDIGIENTFSGSECVNEQNYNDCYHCWSTALARNIRPKGQWLEYNYPSNEYVYCSNCKEKFDTEYLYLGESEYPNYCPNCGADMKEGEV